MFSTRIEKIFASLNCVFIALITYLCIDLFYSVTINSWQTTSSHRSSESVQRKVGKNVKQSNNKSLSYYAVVHQRNLFCMKTDKAEKTEDVSTFEPTELSLKLRGTMVNDKGKSYAIIVDEEKRRREKREQLVMEGGSINDAVLIEVYRDKVVLDVSGRKEILEMEEYGGRKHTRIASRASRTSRGPIKQKKTISRKTINKSLENMNELLTQARVRPHFKNGSPDGFLISRIKRNSLFRKLGLRNGDIIQEVNGEQINSVDEAMAMYERLVSSNSIDIKLKRRGRERVINYNIK